MLGRNYHSFLNVFSHFAVQGVFTPKLTSNCERANIVGMSCFISHVAYVVKKKTNTRKCIDHITLNIHLTKHIQISVPFPLPLRCLIEPQCYIEYLHPCLSVYIWALETMCGCDLAPEAGWHAGPGAAWDGRNPRSGAAGCICFYVLSHLTVLS